MNPANFSDVIKLANVKNISKLKEIAVFAQNIEDQLWDGYPYVYPSIRILMEHSYDYIIDTLLKQNVLVIQYNPVDGMDFRKLKNYLDGCDKKRSLVHAFSKPLVLRRESDLSIASKEVIVRYYLYSVGVYESTDESWGTRLLVKGLNKRAHKIDLLESYPSDKRHEIYRHRFGVMELLYEGFFRGFIEATFTVDSRSDASWILKTYHFPTEEEFNEIYRKYEKRLNRVNQYK